MAPNPRNGLQLSFRRIRRIQWTLHAQSCAIVWNIAGNYLKDEARHDFWSEATLFVVITITAALPLMNNLHALIEFMRAIISH